MTDDSDIVERLRELPRELPEDVMQRTSVRLRTAVEAAPESLRRLPLVPLPKAVVARARLWVRGHHLAGQRSRRLAWAGGLATAAVAAAVVVLAVREPRLSARIATASQAHVVSAEHRALAGAGVELSVGDTLRTSAGGSATMVVPGARVQLDGETEVRIAELGAAPRLELHDGRVQGELASRGTLVVSVGRESVRLLRGSVGFLRTADGQLAVAALEPAEIEIGGRVTKLSPAQMALARDGAAVVQPLPPLFAIELLKARAGAAPAEVELTGRTTPAVLLVVNDERVAVDDSGRFVARLRLDDTGRVVAVGKDAAGRVRRVEEYLQPPLRSTYQWRGTVEDP